MKKLLFLLGGLISSWAINAQVLSNADQAILFTGEDINGTARYNALSGAFGALGGDYSAIEVNPAGLAVFKNSGFSASASLRNTDIETTFYGNAINSNDNFFNVNQLGGVFVFNAGRDSDIKKFAIGFNYSISRDFENSWLASGTPLTPNNEPIAPITDFYDPDANYGIFEGTDFRNFTNGQNEKLVLTLASQPNEKVYIGASLTTYNLEYSQFTQVKEFNRDDSDNTFDVSADEELITIGNGVSFGLGIITKPTKEMRLGIAYQSPTWYNLSEEFIAYEDELFFNNQLDAPSGVADSSIFDYNMTTPGKLTGSFAYLFGKEGLISVDYSYKDYKNIKLRPTGEYNQENQFFSNNLQASSEFRVGAEWRIDNVSLRGGYRFEESPFKDAVDSEHISGYSLGIGFKFKGNTRLDLSYQTSDNTTVYNFVNGADPANLNINNDQFTATLAISL